MRERYVLKTLEQLKVLTHPLRLKILELLTDKPMTTKQVAQALGEDPLKLYYHVEALEKAGLIELVEKRLKANLQEKYYQAVAKSFTVDKSAFTFKSREAAGTAAELLSNLLDIIREEIHKSPLHKTLEEQPKEPRKYTLISHHYHIQASQKAITQLGEKIKKLSEEAQQANQEQAELSYCLAILFFPLQES